MSKVKAIGMCLICLLGLGFGYVCYQTISQMSLDEQIQLDLTLTIESPDNLLDYRANYHWGAKGIDDIQQSSNVDWISRSSKAQVLSIGKLTDKIKDSFSDVSILTGDRFDMDPDGTWNINLEKKLTEGVYLDLEAWGRNKTVDYMGPRLRVQFVPSTLSNALGSLDLDSVNVVVSMKLNIAGKAVELFIKNSYNLIMDIGSIVGDVTDLLVGSIDI